MLLSSFNLNVPHEVNKILKKLEDVAGEIDTPVMTEMMKSKRRKITMNRCYTSSLVDESSVVGREKDKEEILKLLLPMNGAREGTVGVISIMGMAGIGKTVLAQIVYNDAEVVEKFDLRMWVSVSINSDVMQVTKSIVESATGEVLMLSNLDPMQLRLCKIIKDKKVLLVLDDMWEESIQNWDVVRLPFRVAAKGSKILVTTRSKFVSSVVATVPAYNLQPLSDEDCWKLIKQMALSNRNCSELENLTMVGRKIAEKCSGLPLSAKTLGSVLSLTLQVKEWDAVLGSEIWDLPQARTHIFPALWLSFDSLPSHLKTCFIYCSVFPCNYDYEKGHLIQLWAAEGFVQAERMRRIDDIGRDYFDDLLARSFFHFSHVNDLGQAIYKMHGLVHKFAQLISTDLCFRLEDEISNLLPVYRHVRHSSWLCKNFKSTTLEVLHKYKGLRTFMVHSIGCQNASIPYYFFAHLPRLRVLNLSSTGISELPESIENLDHLRHLDVSETSIVKLPESVTTLYGLQTLNLSGCNQFLQWPRNMKNLINLQHLYFLDMKHQLSSMPSNFGKLTKIETLSAFIVGKGEGFRISELQNMRSIQGSLWITNLENVGNVKEAKAAILDNKLYLVKLELEWNKAPHASHHHKVQAGILASLRPHNALEELRITNYSGFMFPNWLSDPAFSKLVTLYLRNCRYCGILPSLGQLPVLEVLDIDAMYELVSIDHGFCGSGPSGTIKGFLSLKSLRFHDMPKLETWEGLNAMDMPCLHHLMIEECPLLETIPSLQYLTSLEELEFSQCRDLALPMGPLPDSLKELIINECDFLRDRCRIEEGADWGKIKDIQRIEIDHNEISLLV
ncbi:putative disease resistance RPP13-like protein 1 [Tripterygium wilfordii]|uniref:putative disease resistance RPP13-like protein 1 n=1 Tax=Tripterygium wilfordii TaxID=458696 RepID=UPI0018F85558|nr:putative disease resistance RPP13-like protein 1 [Tripterygium wilfordii]